MQISVDKLIEQTKLDEEKINQRNAKFKLLKRTFPDAIADDIENGNKEFISNKVGPETPNVKKKFLVNNNVPGGRVAMRFVKELVVNSKPPTTLEVYSAKTYPLDGAKLNTLLNLLGKTKIIEKDLFKVLGIPVEEKEKSK